MSEPTAVAGLLQGLADQEHQAPRSDVARLAVRLRARDACEYCGLPTVGHFHVAHVIPPVRWADYQAGRLSFPPAPARRGPDHVDNFAWCCPFCNARKGAQVEHRVEGASSRLFDPRRDVWREHFAHARGGLLVVGTSAVGRATELALGLNDERHRLLRQSLVEEHRYPPAWSRGWPMLDAGES